jgi:hypothetical protein
MYLTLQKRAKNLTASADLHFFLPVLLDHAVTDGSIDKPAKVTGPKFPGRAAMFLFSGALFYSPARL